MFSARVKQIYRRVLGVVRSYSLFLRFGHEYELGSPLWLIAAERRFGGRIAGIKRKTVSAFDPRSASTLAVGGMIGGDRMVYHGYAERYSMHLERFLSKDEPLTVVEVGILKGSGLAIWSCLFPKADIIGLDIDPSYFYENVDFLKSRGAFCEKDPEIYNFDQFLDNTLFLKKVLNGRSANIVIDDGHHSDESIVFTMRSFDGVLARDFLYIVEDNSDFIKNSSILTGQFASCRVCSYGELTVMEGG